ncbi:MAG: hypothetical protein LBC88_10140 [Spirochaetaceae bacterium]|nr:hypothetical protein [Spirochaetaceae bacterium]
MTAAVFVLLAACGGDFIDEGRLGSGLTVRSDTVRVSDLYEEWLWRETDAPHLRSLAISETSVNNFIYDRRHASDISQRINYDSNNWLQVANDRRESGVDRMYPAGFVITAMAENYPGSNVLPEKVMHELYLHGDKQSLIEYVDGTYYIYTRGAVAGSQ